MRSADYKAELYRTYVSNFTQLGRKPIDYGFSDSKLIPLLRPWTSQLAPTVPCLDLGCGNGNVLHALSTLGFRNLTGIDLSEEQVALARAVTADVTCGNIADFMRNRAQPNTYGLITLFDVIEHLSKMEIMDLMVDVSRCLLPGGVFICHCPNGDSPFVGNVFAGDFTHETLLNPQSARHICTVMGLTHFSAVEHLGASSSIVGYLRVLMWAASLWALIGVNIVETGASCSRVLTLNFAFKAEKAVADIPLPPKRSA